MEWERVEFVDRDLVVVANLRDHFGWRHQFHCPGKICTGTVVAALCTPRHNNPRDGVVLACGLHRREKRPHDRRRPRVQPLGVVDRDRLDLALLAGDNVQCKT